MNLIVDIGNTRTKFSVFNQNKEIFTDSVSEFLPSHVDNLLNSYPPISKAILSSVRDYSFELKEYLRKKFNPFIELDDTTPLPIEICYISKDTLGKDRVAATVGAFYLFPYANTLVIDAGTAITYDIVNKKGQYEGGNISPGIDLRFRALHQFTGRLPLVEKRNFQKLFGKTTVEAILAGVQHGAIYEVEGAIDRFKNSYKNLNVIITGGDAYFFDKKLKNSFFVRSNLIAIGLNRILEYNGGI